MLSLKRNDFGFNAAYSKHHVLHPLVDLQTCQKMKANFLFKIMGAYSVPFLENIAFPDLYIT